MGIVIRHAEPGDYEAIHRIFSGSRVIEGTLQLPLPSAEMWRKRLSEKPEGVYALVACVDGEVVGDLTLETYPTLWRRRHVGQIGMAVRDDWQGKGVGTALMEAALDLADNWLSLTRIELSVYTDNAAGVALYEKFGFEIEGTHRRFAFRGGRYVDAYSMARLRDLPSSSGLAFTWTSTLPLRACSPDSPSLPARRRSGSLPRPGPLSHRKVPEEKATFASP